MAKQVDWTKRLVTNFEEKAMLSPDECYIMESRIKGATVTEQAMHLNKGVSTVHAMIKTIKHKYDRVQKEYPDEFPIRRTSKEEKYMDSN